MKLNSPEEAYGWADKHGPSDESRQAVLSSPHHAFLYAYDVDESPRDDTRQAVLSSPKYTYFYAQYIDKSPRDDTRQAVLSSPKWTYLYVKDVDRGVIHPDVVKVMKSLLLTSGEWAVKLFKEFGDEK